MSDPVKVVFGVLTTYERNGWVHPSILQYFADLPFQTGAAYRVVMIHNFVPAAAGRNVFCRNYKDCDADWICMIDNDMEIPHELLDTVKGAPADAGIVVPAFYMWVQDKKELTLCWGSDNIPTARPGFAQIGHGFHELTKAGTGVIFVRPWVFQKVPYPYFRYLYNEDCGLAGTEDLQFCMNARDLGIKIYGNADAVVGHYHSVELSSMWKWAEKMYAKKPLDTKCDTVAESPSKDAASPAAPQAVKANPAVAA